ncbi:MAG: hypothetical protein BWY92_01872 [Firmicutes bacterium ADurb.BinA052]|nr:MAG: hypothetical protein BWY92_01872 [Firmicutes bacterium ADurb.BinA052]
MRRKSYTPCSTAASIRLRAITAPSMPRGANLAIPMPNPTIPEKEACTSEVMTALTSPTPRPRVDAYSTFSNAAKPSPAETA